MYLRAERPALRVILLRSWSGQLGNTATLLHVERLPNVSIQVLEDAKGAWRLDNYNILVVCPPTFCVSLSTWQRFANGDFSRSTVTV
jgi:hypothetical protein